MSEQNENLMPKGEYIARGVGTPKLGEYEKPFVEVRVRVLEGPYADEEITDRLYFSEAALPYSIEKLRTLGCTFPDDNAADFSGFGSVDVQIVVDHDTWKGVTRPRVKFYNRLTRRNAKTPNAMAEAMERARKLLRDRDAEQTRVKPADEPPPISEADLPF